MEESAETTEILKKIAVKYYPNEQLIDEEIKRSGKAVQLFEIEIEHLFSEIVKQHSNNDLKILLEKYKISEPDLIRDLSRSVARLP